MQNPHTHITVKIKNNCKYFECMHLCANKQYFFLFCFCLTIVVIVFNYKNCV